MLSRGRFDNAGGNNRTCLNRRFKLASVRLQMVDFGSEHVSRRSPWAKTEGLSNFETDGVAVPALAGVAKQVPIVVHSGLCRKSLTGYAIISKERKRRSGPKDAVCGWALVKPRYNENNQPYDRLPTQWPA